MADHRHPQHHKRPPATAGAAGAPPILPPCIVVPHRSPWHRPHSPPPPPQLPRARHDEIFPRPVVAVARKSHDENMKRPFPTHKGMTGQDSDEKKECSVKLAIDALHRAVSPQERIRALHTCLATFSHEQVDRHDHEISVGADTALCLRLGYAVVAGVGVGGGAAAAGEKPMLGSYLSSSHPNNNNTVESSNPPSLFHDEMILTCQCFLQIYKCSTERLLESFRHVGATELVPLLINHLLEPLWGHVAQNNKKDAMEENRQPPPGQCSSGQKRPFGPTEVDKKSSDEPTDTNDNLLLCVLQVLRVYTKLVPAKSLLIRYRKGVWLSQILLTIRNWLDDDPTSLLSDSIPQIILWECLGLIKDLSFRSTSSDKLRLMSMRGGLLKSSLWSRGESITSLHPRVQEWFTAVVWNLALDPMTCTELLKDPIPSSLPQNVIVEGLFRMLLYHSTQGKITGLSNKIKRNAISAIGNISSDVRQCSKLTVDDSLALLPRLMTLVEKDRDSVVRRRAMRTIRCLATSPDKQIQLFVWQQQRLLFFLTQTISRNISSDDENDHDMLMQACETMTAILDGDSDELDGQTDFSDVVNALTCRIESTTSESLIAASVQCLNVCMKRKQHLTESDNISELVWKRLEATAQISTDSHGWISTFLLDLAMLEKNGFVEIGIEQPAAQNGLDTTSRSNRLANHTVINLISIMISASIATDAAGLAKRETVRNQLLQVLHVLLEKEQNKPILAENDQLLSNLVNLCLVLDPTSKEKDLAKRVILSLVPEI